MEETQMHLVHAVNLVANSGETVNRVECLLKKKNSISSYPRRMFIYENFLSWRHQWKHFQRYWPFVRGIHRSPVNSPYKGQWRGALMFSLICTRINGWVNNGEAGDLRRKHYYVTLMYFSYRESDILIETNLMATSLPYILNLIDTNSRASFDTTDWLECVVNNTLHIAGLVPDCSNSIANTLELPQSCTKPSICRQIISVR